MARRESKGKSGHNKKRWRVTFKLPILTHQHTQRVIELDTSEYTYVTIADPMGAAINRAYLQLKKQPELKGAIIRECIITVKCLGYADPEPEPEPSTDAQPTALTHSYSDLGGFEPLPSEGGDITTCPNCHQQFNYPKGSMAYTKHMVGECCIGMAEADEPLEFKRNEEPGE